MPSADVQDSQGIKRRERERDFQFRQKLNADRALQSPDIRTSGELNMQSAPAQ